MGILAWSVFGLIAGVLAKVILPGDDPGGFIVTILLGIAGAVVGGFIATALGFGDVTGFDFSSFLIAVLGAILLPVGALQNDEAVGVLFLHRRRPRGGWLFFRCCKVKD